MPLRNIAKKGDPVIGIDTHLVVPPTGGNPVPTPFPFRGELDEELSEDVLVADQPVAVVGSTAKNDPAHVPDKGSFSKPPTNQGKVITGASNVFANDRPMARTGDLVETCNDPKDLPTAVVVGAGSVYAGEDEPEPPHQRDQG